MTPQIQTKWFLALLAGVAFMISVMPSPAQSYSIPWSRIAGGGGSSSGGIYSLNGTIGQAEAGPAMTGGTYALTGGFWSMIAAVQTAGLPQLTITASGRNVTLSWPATGTYSLQQTPAVSGNVTWTASSYSVTTTNGINSVTLTAPTGTLFFRLKQ